MSGESTGRQWTKRRMRITVYGNLLAGLSTHLDLWLIERIMLVRHVS